MENLHVDIETYCELDIQKVGSYKYINHPSFQVMLIYIHYKGEYIGLDYMTRSVYSDKFEKGEDIFECVEDYIKEKMYDPSITKNAFNTNFERVALSKHFGKAIPIENWRCSMIHSLYLGLPGSLAKVGEVLEIEEDKAKLKEGKELIKYFCKPCKPTKTNGKRTRNLPLHAPEKWERFNEYCKRDVMAEMEIDKKLKPYPIPKKEIELWFADQRILDRGIMLDRKLVENAVSLYTNLRKELKAEAKEISGVQNPNSVKQIKDWLTEEKGIDAHEIGFRKDTYKKITNMTDDKDVKRIIEIRKGLGKTSNSKYRAMQRGVQDDDRLRGILQFYGANRTGRWAGRLVQIQNLPQNKIKELDMARDFLKNGPQEALGILWDSPNVIMSQLIRTAFIPKPGCKFYVSDYSAIEARMIAWVSGEKWRMDVFNSHGKIYEASASQMFSVPIETIEKGKENYPLRAKGKVAELALGYGGSVGALKAMGALKMGLEENELRPLVSRWRKTSPAIVSFWWDIDRAAKRAVKGRATTYVKTKTVTLSFAVESGILFIGLPSGRRLAYIRPRIEPDPKFGGTRLTYEGVDQTKNNWTRLDTYGPKLVENIIQAMSRDCLAYSIMNLEKAGYEIVAHVHDEVIIEAPKDKADKKLSDIENIMAIRPNWASSLPLNADGYHCDYYKKD